MKDGFSEGFVIGFQVGVAFTNVAMPKKITEKEETRRMVADAKQRAREWAIKTYGIKKK